MFSAFCALRSLYIENDEFILSGYVEVNDVELINKEFIRDSY